MSYYQDILANEARTKGVSHRYLDILTEADRNKEWWKIDIIIALKRYILANTAFRNNPISWRSVMPHSSDPCYKTYSSQKKEYEEAYSNLWRLTDMEYTEDGFRNLFWEWRYWKVMARKCCWYQTSIITDYKAGKTMAALQKAEYDFVKACGLETEYVSACEHIEKQFPNLKS